MRQFFFASSFYDSPLSPFPGVRQQHRARICVAHVLPGGWKVVEEEEVEMGRGISLDSVLNMVILSTFTLCENPEEEPNPGRTFRAYRSPLPPLKCPPPKGRKGAPSFQANLCPLQGATHSQCLSFINHTHNVPPLLMTQHSEQQ